MKLTLFGKNLHSCESICLNCEIFPRIFYLIRKGTSIYVLKIQKTLKFLAHMECLILGLKNRIILREIIRFISKNCLFPENAFNLKILLQTLINWPQV